MIPLICGIKKKKKEKNKKDIHMSKTKRDTQTKKTNIGVPKWKGGGRKDKLRG